MGTNIRNIMAIGVALAMVPAVARAQTETAGFGTYPVQSNTGSGANMYRAGAPYMYYGPAMAPPATGGGYSGYTTPYTPRYYAPSYTYRPGVTNYRSYYSGYYAPGPGLGVTAPGARYYLPGTASYGSYRYPGTASYGTGLWRPGYSTYISPASGAYVMPRTNFLRRYVR